MMRFTHSLLAVSIIVTQLAFAEDSSQTVQAQPASRATTSDQVLQRQTSVVTDAPASALFPENISWNDRLDELCRPLLDGPEAVAGLVVGVLLPNGDRHIAGYGHKSAGSGPPDATTLFEIGSITKVFTGLLLATFVESHKARLDDRAIDYLPPGFKLPTRGHRQISLVELATHSSGLPRIAPNMKPYTIWDLVSGRTGLENPWADYDLERVKLGVAQIKLEDIESPPYEYSNLGIGLLGECLAHRAGLSYEQLLSREITGPLGIPDTRQTLTEEQRGRLATGHRGNSKPVPNWSFASLAGCGALYSTAGDLLSLMAVECGHVDTPLSPAIRLSLQDHRRETPTFSMGFAWHIIRSKDGRVCWIHNGGTNGYTGFVGLCRDPKVAVVVLSNTGTSTLPDSKPIDRLGIEIFQLLLISSD